MKCPNCGAKLQNKLNCPYCGYENHDQAKLQHKSEIASVYDKIARLLRRPEERAQKATAGIIRVTKRIILLFLVLAVLALGIAAFWPKIALSRQNQALETLEGYYAAGDYDSMAAFLDKRSDSYKAVYDKYQTVAQLHSALEYLEESIPETLDLIRTDPSASNLLEYDLCRLFELLLRCGQLETAGYVYDEEAAVDQFRQRASMLLDALLFTEDMIREGLRIAEAEDQDYSELTNTVAELLTGGNQ